MKIQKLKRTFFLDSHRTMERFRLFFLILCAVLLATTAVAFLRLQERQQVSLTDDALLTERFRFSRSGVTGSVEGVYVNRDRTRAFVMLRLDDVRTISTDATNYRIFFSAHRGPSANTPAGAIYIFGSSGYKGLYFTDAGGFVPQVSDITVWNTQDLIGLPPANPAGAASERYDDMQIFVNLGARYATHLEVLDRDGPLDIVELFAQTVSDARLSEITTDLNRTLSEMELSLLRIEELRTRLERDGVVVPPDPVEIRGDRIVREDDVLRTVFASPMPGGYDFAWRGRTVSDGFIELVVPNSAELRAHMRQMDAYRRGGVAHIRPDMEWLYTDGTPVNDRDGGTIADRELAIRADIAALEQEWRNFYTLRRRYQTELLPQLLILDENTRDRVTGFTVHYGADALTIW